ncbi:hypothetical protein BKA67DRAFT_647815 [Truncatella angustata]|uniref:Uncharacterized protein n=1 Tax=Truncatella angustata TaxID=152316 RepID=A0A9P8ZWE0_9PEZI|nr:uncharacterized protein BKA67DRAFT_647815 [Truncatella angustata]KAH6651858.1 hypothetical protein BKA67DRAFT_647815 [Truncatella angustata]
MFLNIWGRARVQTCRNSLTQSRSMANKTRRLRLSSAMQLSKRMTTLWAWTARSARGTARQDVLELMCMAVHDPSWSVFWTRLTTASIRHPGKSGTFFQSDLSQEHHERGSRCSPAKHEVPFVPLIALKHEGDMGLCHRQTFHLIYLQRILFATKKVQDSLVTTLTAPGLAAALALDRKGNALAPLSSCPPTAGSVAGRGTIASAIEFRFSGKSGVPRLGQAITFLADPEATRSAFGSSNQHPLAGC